VATVPGRDGTLREVPLLNAGEAAGEGARCAYVDNDPLAVAHVRALLCGGKGAVMVEADPFSPEAVLRHPDLARMIDLTEPVCLVFGMAAGYLPPGRASEVITAYTQALAPGSFAVISAARIAPGPWEDVKAAYGAARIWNHSPRVVRSFFL